MISLHYQLCLHRHLQLIGKNDFVLAFVSPYFVGLGKEHHPVYLQPHKLLLLSFLVGIVPLLELPKDSQLVTRE